MQLRGLPAWALDWQTSEREIRVCACISGAVPGSIAFANKIEVASLGTWFRAARTNDCRGSDWALGALCRICSIPQSQMLVICISKPFPQPIFIVGGWGIGYDFMRPACGLPNFENGKAVTPVLCLP